MRKTMMAPFLAEEHPRDLFSVFMRDVRAALAAQHGLAPHVIGQLWYCGTDHAVTFVRTDTGSHQRYLVQRPTGAPLTLVRAR